MTKEPGIVKIIALDEKDSGSKFHRCYLPLAALHGKEVEIEGILHKIEVKFIDRGRDNHYFSEEDIQEADIIYCNWAVMNTEGSLSVSLKRYNTLFFTDVDDLWKYFNTHIQKHEEDEGKVIRQIAQYDIVIASTIKLVEHCRQYNQFSVVSYNDLPLEIGQFTTKEKKREGKLKVGILGSISHAPDWLLLKGAINRFSKNTEIVKNCKFIIAGYKKHPYWDSIVKLFKVKKNLEVEIIEGLPVDEYMSLYEKLDVCLMPLIDDEFNKTKSFLKLRECAIKGVVPIGSKLYSEKDGKVGILEAEIPLQYEKWIEYLLKDNNFEATSFKMSKINLATNNFEKRIDDLKKVIEFSFTKEFQEVRNKVPDNLKIYSIVYSPEQICEYEKYDNSHIRTLKQKSWRFEYNVILDIVDKNPEGNEYLGIFSYKFPFKTQLSSKIIYGLFNEVMALDRKLDLINLSPVYWKSGEEYMKFSDTQHPNLINLLKMCLDKLEKPYFSNPKTIIYSNYFLLKKELYKEYVEKWIKPCLEYMETEIWDIVNVDSTYKSGLSKEQLKEYTGSEIYNMTTFILESLIFQIVEFKHLRTQSIL